MSAPNDPYDPKQVAALSEAALATALSNGEKAFVEAGSLEQLALAKVAHLGDRSPVRLANREIAALPPHAKGDAGRRVNETLRALTAAYDERLVDLEAERDARALAEESVDVTLPVTWHRPGARHPLTALSERIADIFVGMGYEVAEGPEVEHEWFNFDALNIGPDHPVRDAQDTLFVAPEGSGLVMRTHTSPVQVRSLLSRDLPVYIVCPGRTYRNDPLDATHTPVFHQVEGLAVDKGITMAHLRGTLTAFVEGIFGEGLPTRWRPAYFPFTEPSAEMDLQCFVCRGASALPGAEPCRTCQSEGWIELGGCGMVNPRVLIACGIDPEVYTGFAFGMGIDRTLMFRHGIEDIRHLIEGDVRFSLAFGTYGQES
jgi:phenylalanyl-tRNA synthetase alpha chain